MTDGPPELAIIEQSLDDIQRRVGGAPQTPRMQELLSRALAFRNAVRMLGSDKPSDEARSAIMQKVLSLQIEVMEAGISDANAPDSEPRVR